MKWPITKARVLPALFLLACGQVALAQPVATQQTSASYAAGALLGATNSFSYSGTLWSLLWRPQLPAGWTIASVSGTGNPELQSGEIVWTGTMPASPIQMVYTVQVPANASGGHNLRGELEYQLAGMVNPATQYASPDPLIVSEPLVAFFSATPTNGLVPLTVAFTNQSANATDYSWNFGDGNTSTNVHPLNTYSNAGTYSVTLTAIGTGGTSTLTRTNYIVVMDRASSSPRLVVLPAGGTNFIFAFDTVPGLAYLVQFKDTFEDLNWQSAQSVPGDGTRMTITNEVSAPAQRFYRLWVQ